MKVTREEIEQLRLAEEARTKLGFGDSGIQLLLAALDEREEMLAKVWMWVPLMRGGKFEVK